MNGIFFILTFVFFGFLILWGICILYVDYGFTLFQCTCFFAIGLFLLYTIIGDLKLWRRASSKIDCEDDDEDSYSGLDSDAY